MRYLAFFIIFLSAFLSGITQANELACQSQQLAAAAKLCNSQLRCEAALLKANGADMAAYNTCVTRSKNAFSKAYKQALAENGACWLKQPVETVLPRWLAAVNGAPLPFSDTRQSLKQLLRFGVGDSQAERDLHAALLEKSGLACQSALTAYAEYAHHSDADSLVAGLRKSQTSWLQNSKKLLTAAQEQGINYLGKPTAVVYDRIDLLAGQQAQDTAVNSNRPQPTATGMPEGGAHSAVIGPAGGIISAGPGLIKLKIPEGALAQNTKITIQPLTNHIPGGKGLGYQFRPVGLQFAKPVTVILPYTPEQTQADNHGISYQDSQGFWHGSAQLASVNETDSTLSFKINRLRNWGFYQRWYLNQDVTEVNTDEQASLIVIHDDCVITGSEDCLLTPLESREEVKSWSVNGVAGGNKILGTVSGDSQGIYVAPAKVPKHNPVNVSAVVDTHSAKTGQLQLVGQIWIKPKWHGYLQYSFNGHNASHDGDTQVTRESLHFSATFAVKSVLGEVGNLLMLEVGKPNVSLSYDKYERWWCGRYFETVLGQASGLYDDYPNSLVWTVERNGTDAYKMYSVPTAMADAATEWREQQVCVDPGEQTGSKEKFVIQMIPAWLPLMSWDNADHQQLSGTTSVQGLYDFQNLGTFQGTMTVNWDLRYR